jgi:hypothetical protein
MWIIIKLLFVTLAFTSRIFAKFWRSATVNIIESEIKGTRFKIIPIRTMENSVEGTILQFHFPCNSVFVLSEETRYDRYFKKIGISSEIETGDRVFDNRIYIASDSSAFSDKIKNDAKTRQIILQLFDQNCRNIRCDGKTLWVNFQYNQSKDVSRQQKAISLLHQLQDINQKESGFFRDPFMIMAVVTEAIVWSWCAYGIAGFYEWRIFNEDRFVDGLSLILLGVLTGIICTVVFLVLVFLLFRRSSLGHRIVIESAIALLLTLPVGGIELVADINTELDHSPSVLIERRIINVEERRSINLFFLRGHRPSYSYHVHLDCSNVEGGIELPNEIEIDTSLRRAAEVSSHIVVEIGAGRLNYPWYRSFRFFSK